MTKKQLKIFLDEQAERFENPQFITDDPLAVVKRFTKKQDQEIVGLLASSIAWGNRKAIITSTERILAAMEQQPFLFLNETDEKDWKSIEFVHRTFNKEDLLFFFNALKQVYKKHKSLADLFVPNPDIKGVKGRIVNFRSQFCNVPHLPRSEKHVSNPAKGSASKRLNMFLRWMVRPADKGVDLGIWNHIPTSELRIPLDVHTARVARKLKLLNRNTNDWAALEEIHQTLDEFNPNDPAMYDFALFGLGISGF